MGRIIEEKRKPRMDPVDGSERLLVTGGQFTIIKVTCQEILYIFL
jgi:hypothetical protein